MTKRLSSEVILKSIISLIVLLSSLSYSQNFDALECQVGEDEKTRFIMKTENNPSINGLDIEESGLYFSIKAYKTKVSVKAFHSIQDIIILDDHHIFSGSPMTNTFTEVEKVFLAFPETLIKSKFKNVDYSFRSELIIHLYKNRNVEFGRVLDCKTLF